MRPSYQSGRRASVRPPVGVVLKAGDTKVQCGRTAAVTRHMAPENLSPNLVLGRRTPVEDVPEPIDRTEVFRYIGYPADVEPPAHLDEILDEWIDKAAALAAPKAAYAVYRVVDLDKRRLVIDGPDEPTEFVGAIGEFLGTARAMTIFIATAGPGVEQLASQLIQRGDALEALIVNAVGAERAEAAESVIIERLREEAAPAQLAPTLPYSPGYCGMALVEQRKLFSLMSGETAGVTLSESCLMNPIKSVSGLIGLSPPEEIQEYGSPCDRCELKSCNMRR